MRVSRARISGSMLSRLGARWVTMTKAMPGSDGMALNKYSSASTPPAEAPTPTMGNGLSIGSPSRDREETGLPAVGGSRQGYAKILGIQRAFAGLAMRLIDGSVRDKSLCARSTVVRAESISSRSCEISRRVVSINARVLVTRSRCSESMGLAPEGSSGVMTLASSNIGSHDMSRHAPPQRGRPVKYNRRNGHLVPGFGRVPAKPLLPGGIDLLADLNSALAGLPLLDRQQHAKSREATERRLKRAF